MRNFQNGALMTVSIFWCLFISLTAQAAPTFLHIDCSDEATYTPNSTFQDNLKLLLTSLSSNTTKHNGFFNSTIGNNSPDAAYGLSLCRGDFSSDICQACVSAATTDILNRCPKEKEAAIWYEECMVRYADQSFITVENIKLSTFGSTDRTPTDETRFKEVLNRTLNNIIAQASSNVKLVDPTTQAITRFATQNVSYAPARTLYALVQCTPDLSGDDCSHCLRKATSYLARCCNGKEGGRVCLWSCNFRFEMFPFFNMLDSAPSPPSTLTSSQKHKGNDQISTRKLLILVSLVSASLMLCVIGCCLLAWTKANRKGEVSADGSGRYIMKLIDIEDDSANAECLRYDLSTIKAATNNFSIVNKIGEGGFGEVFKGVLCNGKEIAVKRLCKSSRQGTEEFKNEVILVAKLQHKNLVRLLRFCLEGEEKIIVYEYIPNQSLDNILFDPEKNVQLDWTRRHKIISGIAKGMLYLHEESQLRVIHRDLKPSNILLDADMNAKVSDFGMARIFGVDQIQGKTSRIVGTCGYMSPEYAMHGHYSVRSDVFSFGVLVLEIISGKRNSSFYQSNHVEDLLCYAWRLWTNGTPLELMDPVLSHSYLSIEVTKCIYIGLLCVQDDVDARPTMESIVLMLHSHSDTIIMPQQPPRFVHNRNSLKIREGL